MDKQELIVSEFSGEVQKKILDKLSAEYLATGKYVKDQMSLSPKIWTSIALTGGAAGTAISAAATSQTLYMATANPATLMKSSKVAGGVYTAVTAPSGTITAQAPFIPVASSSFPVVAPLMAMQALSTIVVLQQFVEVNRKLDAIKETIDEVLIREEITALAELYAAICMVDEIYLQFSLAGRFSTDMLVRLAIAEHDATVLSKRYELLSGSETKDAPSKSLKKADYCCLMLASLLNLRVKHLRTCVDIQENPQFIQHSSENFMTLLKKDIELWDELLNRSKKMKEDIDKREAERERVKGLQKYNSEMKENEKELGRKKKDYSAVLEIENTIMKDFFGQIHSAKQMSETVIPEELPSVLYWRDDEGEHCYCDEGVGGGVVCPYYTTSHPRKISYFRRTLA